MAEEIVRVLADPDLAESPACVQRRRPILRRGRDAGDGDGSVAGTDAPAARFGAGAGPHRPVTTCVIVA